MSRTDLDPATLACSLRRMAGDGSVEWVMEPIQAAVLHDVADMLDENGRLRELALDFYDAIDSVFWDGETETKERFKPRMRELGVEVSE